MTPDDLFDGRYQNHLAAHGQALVDAPEDAALGPGGAAPTAAAVSVYPHQVAGMKAFERCAPIRRRGHDQLTELAARYRSVRSWFDHLELQLPIVQVDPVAAFGTAPASDAQLGQ